MSRSQSTSDGQQLTHRKAGTTDVVVIGAGHAGLSCSHLLKQRSVDHVVLERGEVANSWKKERWDSLTLLTPNWQSRLPGFRYQGDNPDGFMSTRELISFIEDYASFVSPPLVQGAEVTEVLPNGAGYRVVSTAGEWRCRAVVIASGACNVASVPGAADGLPRNISNLTPFDYRNPGQLEDAAVLVVGASATGLQLASEIQASGRDVVIATGEHVRMPRRYRGRDIQFWLDRTGILNERYDEIDDVTRARNLPSPQLIGARDPAILDLNRLAAGGAKIVGRLMGLRDGEALFSGSLRNVCALADLKMNRMLNTIDEWVEGNAGVLAAEQPGIGPPERFEATRVEQSPTLRLDFRRSNVRTILWCTGFRPDYRWLKVDVLDRKGRLRHDGGVVESPGMYVIGLPVLRRRKSSFIHGAEDDARDLVDHLAAFLDVTARETSRA